MSPTTPIGLGCMRLSTAPDRDETRAVAVLRAALDAGATLLDTADAYCWSDEDRGHNEHLIARALESWPGDRSAIVVATKGGLARPAGRWVPDGRAKHLIAACEASCLALGVGQIDLYQLHTPDPRVPLATSARALADLKRRGLIKAAGLSNVTLGQIEEARRIVDIDSVQIELSLWRDQQLLSGVLRYCIDHGIRVLAYRPLGGSKGLARTERNPVLRELAADLGAAPADVALAWVAGLADVIVPLPGPTRVETARGVARHRTLQLTEQQTTRLDELCPAARALRSGSATALVTAPRTSAEVVLIMGLPGAGKSTIAQEMAADGYLRLNRDEAGGTLRRLIPALDRAIESGADRIVLDNTYVSRSARSPVIQAAAARGASVRCLWLTTSVADAQVNAASRIVQRYGRLLDAGELAARHKHDPAAFLPTTIFRYQRELEPPHESEGFARVETVAFERRTDPAHSGGAVLIWCDGLLARSRAGSRTPLTPDDVVVDEERAATLRTYAERGVRLLGLSWQPEIEGGTRTAAEVSGIFARMNELLGCVVDVEYCPHAAGPPRCWCRKPLPGLGVLLIHRHRLDPSACIYVGSGTQDASYAATLGFRYQPVNEFFRES